MNFIYPGEDQFPRTWDILKQGVAEGVAPGMVAGVWRQASPGECLLFSVGERRAAVSGLPALPMKADTTFDLASVTKVMATATMAALLVERGWWKWDTPLASVLPEYPYSSGRVPITIEHLLSHTAGLPAWDPFYEKMRQRFAPQDLYRISVKKRQQAMRELVFQIRPETLPGQRVIYSDVSFLLLGFAIEEVVKAPLDRAVRDWLWRPMGLEGAFFRRVNSSPRKSIREECAATEICPWRGGVLQGQVHDDNCWSMGGYAGHAGAFARAQDVLQFSRKMLTGFLSAPILQAAWSRMPQPSGCERTRGWDTPSGDEPAAKGFSDRTVGHLGFTGTSLWIDIRDRLAVTLLTNRVHPTRENPKIKNFRPRFHEMIRRELQ